MAVEIPKYLTHQQLMLPFTQKRVSLTGGEH